MNTLWNFIVSYLPPIRIDNELSPPSNLCQHHDQTTPRPTDADHTRIRQLETLNNRLQEQVLTLQRQLEHIQANFSSTEMELDRQAQADEVYRLRTSYAELANSARTLESNGEELRSLKSFLTKTDEYSGQQIIQAVHDLNTEILQLAAAVSDEFPLTRRSPGLWKESHCEIIREAIGDSMLALLRDGDHEGDPTIVQLAIQAWEVWCCRQVLDPFCAGAPPEVDRFLNDVFREMQSSGKSYLSITHCVHYTDFHNHAPEPQATTSRWRTLTHMYARRVVSNYNSGAPAYPGSLTSSSLTSPITHPPYPYTRFYS